MEAKKERQEQKVRGTTVTEAELEVRKEETLPDYQGEIMKVLFDRADVMLGECFLSEGEAVVQGTVCFRVFFRNREGKLGVSTFDVPIEHSFAAPESAVGFSASASLRSSSVRSTGAKKLSAKAEVSLRLFFTEEKEVSPEITGNDGLRLEMRRACASVFSASEAKTEPRVYSEELARLPDAGEVEILSSGGSVFVEREIPKEGGVLLEGNLFLSSVIRVGEEPPYAIGKTVPFSEFVPDTQVTTGDRLKDGGDFFDQVPGKPGKMPCSREGKIVSCRVFASPSVENEAEKVLIAEAEAVFSALLGEEAQAELCVDCYAVGGDYRSQPAEFSGMRMLCRESATAEVTAKLARSSFPGGEQMLKEPIISCVTVREPSVTPEGDALVLSAAVHFKALFSAFGEDGRMTYIPAEAETRFEKKVNNSCHIDENSKPILTFSAEECKIQFDEESVFFAANLTADLLILSRFSQETLAKIELTAAEEKPGREPYRVYYPAEGDTLWSVCKRYGKPMQEVAMANRFAAEQLEQAFAPESLKNVERIKIV